MFRYSTYFVLAVSISLATCITDYCGRSDLCTDYQHVTCGASGGNGQACPPGSGAIELTSTQVQEILDLHNNFRNQIAGGHVPGYRTAAKMTSMRWNQDFADYAGLNVRRCVYGHDCHNTPQNPSAGQNIFSQTNIGNNVDYMNVGAFIEQAIRNWWSEKDMTSQQYIDNCCSNINTAHFLQMAQDEVNEIGCAISHYPEGPNKKTSYLVCNYSVTNRRDTPVYQTGSPASKCKTGNNPNYSALCSESE